MARLLSAGVLVRVESGELLLGHASGTRHWDIPKGQVDDGETPQQAAVRELKEETGLHLDCSEWHDLGRLAYNRAKDLWLFRTPLITTPIDLAALRCSTSFIDRFGVERLEFDRYRIASRIEIEGLCAPSMARLLLTLDW